MKEEIELIKNKELRDKCIEHYEVLEKVKKLLLIPGTDLMSTEEVANFYGVSDRQIKTLYANHKDEIDKDGCMLLKKDYFNGKELHFTSVKEQTKVIINFQDGQELIISNRGLRAFSKRCVLRIGMLLRESEIASIVRDQLLNIEEKASKSIKIADITEEQRLMIAVGMAMSSGDVTALGVASTNLVAFKNRHISQLEESNTKLEEDNKLLTNGILEWSDRKKLNAGVRKLASVVHVQFGYIWSELYKQLHYKYGINLKARNNGKKPYIENVKESEWNMVVKSFAAICESYDQSPTDMFQQKVSIS